MAEFDSLQLAITAEADAAVSQLKRVAKALGALKGAAKAVHLGGIAGGFAGADGLKDALGKVREAASGFANVDVASIKNTASALRSLSSALGKSYDASNLDSAAKSVSQIDVSGFSAVAEGFESVARAAGAFSTYANVSGFSDIATALGSMNAAGIGNIAGQISDLGRAVTDLSGGETQVDMTALDAIANAAQKMAAGNISGATDSISRFAATLQVLRTSNVAAVSENIASGIERIVGSVKDISDDSIARLRSLTSAIAELGSVQPAQMPAISVRGLNGSADRAASPVSELTQTFGNGFSRASRIAIGVVSGIGSALTKLRERFGLASLGAGEFTKSLIRIAKYRFIRSILSSFTQGAAEGLKNLAHYSASANATLSQLSTGTLYLKNSLGAALYPAIASVIGIFQSLISVVVRALNVISMFFSALGGKSTYMRAKEYAQDYGGALDGAAESAAALKQELMGFDEINALSPSGGGGGGGGGGAGGYGDMFEEVPIDIPFADMIESGDFSPLGMALAAKINEALDGIDWDDIRSKAAKFATGISTFINGFFEEIDPKTIGQTLAGVINTGATFVGTFWSKTDWKLIGTRIGESLTNAIQGIDHIQLAAAIYGRFNAMVDLFTGMLKGLKMEGVGPEVEEAVYRVITGVHLDAAADTLMTALDTAIKLAGYVMSDENIRALSIQIAGALRTVAKRVPELIGSLLNLGIKFVNAVGQGVKDAFKDVTAEDVLNGIREAAGDFLSSIDADAIVNIANLDFTTLVTGSAALGLLLAALKKILPGAHGAQGAGGGMGFGSIASIMLAVSAACELGTYIGRIFSAETSVDEKQESLIKIGVGALFAGLAGLLAFAVGAGGFAALATVAIGFKIGTWIAGITEGEGVVGYQHLTDVMPSISAIVDSMKSGAVDAQTALDQIKGVIEQYTGLTFGENAFENLVEGADVFGSVVEAFEIDPESTIQNIRNLLGAFDTANDTTLGDTNTKLSAFATAWGMVAGATVSDPSTAVDSLSNSASAASESIGGAAEALGNFQTSVDFPPPEWMQTMADNMGETSTQTGLASASLRDMNRALNTLGVNTSLGDMREELVLTSSDATALKDSIVAIPTMKSIYFNILNFDPVLKKVNQLASAIRNIGSKSISIRVKAGLESGSKAFLNALGSLASGTLKASINSLVATSAFAKGGFPTAGDIFIANENGRQELVGRIGNRPAVANQDQIGDAIFRYMSAYGGSNSLDPDRMAAAIVSAMKEAGLGATYLDGRMIAQSINRETQRSGKPAIVF